MKKISLGAAVFLLMVLALRPQAQEPDSITLLPTNHPKVPRNLPELWFAPEGTRTA